MPKLNFNCFSCSKEVSQEHVGFRDECLHCGEDLHVCKNCKFYDESSYNECLEPQADRILEKERNNLCEHFQAKGLGGGGESSKREDLLSAAEALFKKS